MVDAWVGVDPGKKGAMALLDEHNNVTIVDWKDEQTMMKNLELWRMLWNIQICLLERVFAVRGNSKQSDTTFQQHAGAWKCMLNLSGLPWVEVLPQKWMKRRIRAKKSSRDKPSVDYVQRNYPNVNVTGPRGGKLDGRADALCIAEFAKENY